MSKSLAPIIKKYGAKRLKREHAWDEQKILFNSERDASQAVWEIHNTTGRECYNGGNIVYVYP